MMKIVRRILGKKEKSELSRERELLPGEGSGLSLVGDAKNIQLQAGGRALTNGLGLHSAMFIGGRWIDSRAGEWQVCRETAVVRITIVYAPWAVEQQWIFERLPQGLRWTLRIAGESFFAVEKIQAGLSLIADFRRWFSAGHGDTIVLPKLCWQTLPLTGSEPVVFLPDSDTASFPPALRCAQIGTAAVFLLDIPPLEPAAAPCALVHLERNVCAGQAIEAAQPALIVEISLPGAVSAAQLVQSVPAAAAAEPVWPAADISLVREQNTLAVFRRGAAGADERLPELRLSGAEGIHSAMFLDGRWYDSSIARWEWRLSDAQQLVLGVRWDELSVEQLWEFTAVGDGFLWRLTVNGQAATRVERVYAKIALQELFLSWISPAQAGVFFSETDPRQTVTIDVLRHRFVLIEHSRNPYALLIENCGGGRLLVDSPVCTNGKDPMISAEVNGFEQGILTRGPQPIELRVTFCAGAAQIDAVKQRLRALPEQSVSWPAQNVHFQIQRQQLRVFRCSEQDGAPAIQELTGGLGVHTAFFLRGTWYDSQGAEWQCSAEKARLVVDLRWYLLGIAQRWIFEVIEPGKYRWSVHLSGWSSEAVEQLQVGLTFCGAYRRWFCGDQQGIFADPDVARSPLPVYSAPARIVGVESEDCSRYPACVITQPGEAHVLVENTAGPGTATVRTLHFQYDDAVPAFSCAQNPLFIEFIDHHAEVQRRRSAEDRLLGSLQDGDSTLEVFQQRVRLRRRGEEVTAGCGFFIHFLSDGLWYNSSEAPQPWRIEETEKKNTLRVIVDFRPLRPAAFIWEFQLTGALLYWEVLSRLGEPLSLEERRYGIMFNPAYERWFNSMAEQPFPSDFTKGQVFVDNLEDSFLGIAPGGNSVLPAVALHIQEEATQTVRNSDEDCAGRVYSARMVESEQTRRYEASMAIYARCSLRLCADAAEQRALIERERMLDPLPALVQLYAADAELHDRIAGRREFAELMARIGAARAAGGDLIIGIGISRYNFFCLHEIVQLALGIFGRRVNLSTLTLELFPLRRLWKNFREYFDSLRILIEPFKTIKFIVSDPEMFTFFFRVISQVTSSNERHLARLFGLICNHAFIGPQIVVVDPFHRCNANCVHCWVHAPGIEHRPEFLNRQFPWERFTQLADDLQALKTDKIIFQGDGEPLLYEKFSAMVEYARKKEIEVSFFTNGICLDAANAAAAVSWGVDEIFCSLPAGTASTYAKVVPGQCEATFARILDNLRRLRELKKQRGAARPRLIMTHVIHCLNCHELMEMIANDVAVGADTARFYLIRLDANNKALKLSEAQAGQVRRDFTRVREFVRDKPIQLLDTTEFQLAHFDADSGAWSKEIFQEQGCYLGWSFCLIPALGDVSFCCHLRTVGFLADKPFREIWNSPEYNRYRILAKDLRANAQVRFLNGVCLFDEHCEHCDTHQVIRDVWNSLEQYGLKDFVKHGESGLSRHGIDSAD
ncbi:MAG: radical SAM protein [Candidatus Omnitrophica bacterium]|nr:radical SAM protein [Candidatus Omnitrophota bacterium]